MYQYKSVKLALKGFIVSELQDHNEIIDKFAKEGCTNYKLNSNAAFRIWIEI